MDFCAWTFYSKYLALSCQCQCIMQSSLQMMLLNGNIWWNQEMLQQLNTRVMIMLQTGTTDIETICVQLPMQVVNSNGNADNTAYYSKGDYLCFREITLGYDLPKSVCGKLGVSGVSLQCRYQQHRLYHSFFDGLNPEQYDGSETGEYFIPIQFNFGARLTFLMLR